MAQDRKKRYANIQNRSLEFCPEDRVFLKVALWKHMLRFSMKGKLVMGFIGPFKILKRIRSVAYEINLPSQLTKVHNVFHVSLLWKANRDPFEGATSSASGGERRLNTWGKTDKDTWLGREGTS